VFFSNLTCESMTHVFEFRGEMRRGWPAPPSGFVRKERQIAFLTRGLEGFSGPGMRLNWKLFQALTWFNEPVHASTLRNPHVSYSMLWIALETLVSGYNSPLIGGFLPKRALKKARQFIKKWALDQGYSTTQAQTLERSVSRANDAPVTERIVAFLEETGVKASREEVRELSQIRNQMQHSGLFYEGNLLSSYERLRNLLAETIVTLMGLDANEFLSRNRQGFPMPHVAAFESS